MQTMKTLTRLFSLLALVTLAACSGGGGSSGECSFSCKPGGDGPVPSAVVTDIDVQVNPGTLVNTGNATATATITALDANRKSVSGAAITLTVDSGVITPVAGVGTTGTTNPVTDASGKLLATVSLGSNLALRKITVTAESGAIKRSNTVQVVDSPAGAKPTSIELISAASEVGTGGDGIVIRAFVKDANNNALAGTPVSFATSTGTLSQVSTVTDTGGVGSATLSSGADKANREATVTVTSGTISNTLRLPIRGSKLVLSGPSSLILGSAAPFEVTVLDSKSNVVPNVVVTATSTLNNTLAASAPRTDSTGTVSFNYTAVNAGDDNLVFSAAGSSISPKPQLSISGQDFAFTSPRPSTEVTVGALQAVQVRLRVGGVAQAGKVINFTATGGTVSAGSATTDASGLASVVISSASAGPVTVQATVVGSASGTTGATSATLPLLIVAKNPAKLVLQVSPTAIAPNTSATSTNQAQLLAKVTDANDNPVQGQTVNFSRVSDPSGGNLLQASAVTDGAGLASVAYRAGAQSTANNGVIFNATVAGTSVSNIATLTVNQSALFIALGTGNLIANLDPQTYKQDWVVYVTDSNGIAVNGVNLTLKALPSAYITGYLVYSKPDSLWIYDRSKPLYVCRSEDRNGNGILDPGEDDNADGVLWPGNVVAASPNNIATTGGRATISLIYAESYVPWVVLKLTATATVSGTESSTSSTFTIAGEATDFTQQNPGPAATVSPFGALPTPAALAKPGACVQFGGPT
jgi:Bacterial Ig-like domain (group 1)